MQGRRGRAGGAGDHGAEASPGGVPAQAPPDLKVELQQEALGPSLVAKGIWRASVLPTMSQVFFPAVKGNT